MTGNREKDSSAWVKLLCLYTFASLVETIFYGQFGAFTPLYLPKLGIQPADIARWTGLIAAATGLVGLPLLPFWGALADRFSRKPVIIRSFTIELLAGLIAIAASNIWVFLLGRVITSLALGNSGLMMTTLAERAPSNRQGLAFSIMNTAGPLGIFLGPLIGGPIIDHWGFRTLLAIDAALLAIVVLALATGYRDSFKGSQRQPLLRMAGDSIKIILQSARLRTLFPALFMLFAGWMLALSYVTLAIKQLYSGPNLGTIVGFVLGAGGLVALVLTPLFGGLADRYGMWRLLLAGAVVEVILWPLPALTHGLTGFGIAWALINGLGSGVFALSFSVLAQSAEENTRGRVMSFAFLPVNMGLFLGPAIGSLITKVSVFAIFPAAAVFTAIGIGLLLLARRQPVESQAPVPVLLIEQSLPCLNKDC
ncbi:MAG: MFS transporter [Anaerolineaceae bacterium]|nr:MFS transporter [Anaerolineaceae bacterium]